MGYPEKSGKEGKSIKQEKLRKKESPHHGKKEISNEKGIFYSRKYDPETRRLLYFRQKADAEFWDDHWSTGNWKEEITKHKDNRFILKPLQKYASKEGKILEGGCGRGQNVYCMHHHGYDVTGVDFAMDTISNIKRTVPQLDVHYGDVRNLNFQDDYFEVYWSLGVIEHFMEGYDDILMEMKRVLAKDGYLFLTFPYMSPLRKLKARLGLYDKLKDKSELYSELKDNDYNTNGTDDNGTHSHNTLNSLNFYQFCLNQDEIEENLKHYDFELIESHGMDGINGLMEEVTISRPILRGLYGYNGDNLVLKGFIYLLDIIIATFSGHIVFLVFKKR